MKNYLYLAFMAVTAITFSQTPCEGGFAGIYPCNGYDLQSHFSLGDLGASEGNDSWGWTDPMDGKEYALVGLDNGTAFIDISDPVNAVYLGKLPTHTSPSIWRDIKVYEDHAFIVSEAGGHGMQVFDLTRLRNVSNPPVTFTEDAHYDQFGNAHNIVINEETGFAYAVGTNTFNGGPHFVNIQDPLNPVSAGGYAVDGYTHDAQVIVYNGPDSDYTGREVYYGSNEDRFVILDVTNKSNPQNIATVTYPTVEYTHQNWVTEDRKYVLLGDEQDELFGGGFNTRTIVFNVEDLDNPFFEFDYFGPTPAIDHNGYVKGNTFYLANYNAGFRAIDISDIENQNLTEIGYFDTYPSDDDVAFNGSWNVYPYFASGNIVISGTNGFTLVKDPSLNTSGLRDTALLKLFPNPVKDQLTINLSDEMITSVTIFDVLGKKVFSESNFQNSEVTIDTSKLTNGIYLVRVNETMIQKIIK